MSRLSGNSNQIVVKPSNDVFTVLVAVGIVAEIVAMIIMWMVHQNLYSFPLFGSNG